MEWLISPRFLPLPLTTGPLNLPGVPLIPNKPACSSQRASHRAAIRRLLYDLTSRPLRSLQRLSCPSHYGLQSLSPRTPRKPPSHPPFPASQTLHTALTTHRNPSWPHVEYPTPFPIPCLQGSHYHPEVLFRHLCPEALVHPGSGVRS